MEQIVWILTLLLAFIAAPLVIWSRRARRRSRGVAPEANAGREIAAPPPSSAARASSSGTRRMRRRPVSTASASSSTAIVPVAEPETHDEGEQDSDEMADVTYYKTKQSKKKNERKQEKEARREAEVAARDMKKDKQDRQSEMRRQRDEEREAEELQKEEEAERLKLKEEAAAAAEFDKWKTSFSIETEGSEDQTGPEDGQILTNNFVEYIKKHKCVGLEDLAGEFNLRTQDCIDRVIALEQMGRISGVMDERGKFIYISPEEMKAVADYMKRLGRVSISHLAQRSNEFIDLEAKSLASKRAEETVIPFEAYHTAPQISVG